MDEPDSQLIENGRSLVSQLSSLASEYHLKSIQHEMLLWEASIVQAEIDNLLDDVEIPENLRRSVLSTPSGEALAQRIPEVTEQVRSFHHAFRAARRT